MKKYQKLRKNGGFWSVFLSIFIAICIFFVIFNVSDIFSTLITHTHGIFFVDRIDVPSYTIYAVSSEDYDDEILATSRAEEIRSIGAMGVVYKHGEYFVLTSTYPSLLEAQEVQKNLINLGYNSRILNINVPAFQKNYKGRDKEKIERTISQFRKIYLNLFEIDVEFDRGSISRSNLNGRLAQVMTENIEVIEDFSSVKKLSSMDKEGILSALSLATQKMEEVLYSSSSNDLTSSLLKQKMLEIVELNISLVTQ